MKPGPKIKPQVYTIILEPDAAATIRKNAFWFESYLAQDFRNRVHIAGGSDFTQLKHKVLDYLNTGKLPKDRVNPEQLLFKIY